MDHLIEHLEIRNFKSIRELKLSGFKRINLFIGRPNVGKSNLLEALSLFAIPYLWNNRVRRLKDLVRLQNPVELFYQGNLSEISFISLKRWQYEEKEECRILYEPDKGELKCTIFISRPNNPLHGAVDSFARDGHYPSEQYRVEFTFENNLKGGQSYFAKEYRDFVQDIKPYSFKNSIPYRQIQIPFLNPPFGDNILHVLQLMPELRQLYASWFRSYGLRLVLDATNQSLRIQRDIGADEVFQLPYSSVADTLQRIIFYKTAVASNKNSVLLFEEPEAHAYPPYISEFTQEVIKSKTNQTFIVTHSPLVVEQFLTEAIDDLGIFMVDFKDGQTVVKGLTTDEIREVYKYGMDLFFNGEAYLD